MVIHILFVIEIFVDIAVGAHAGAINNAKACSVQLASSPTMESGTCLISWFPSWLLLVCLFLLPLHPQPPTLASDLLLTKKCERQSGQAISTWRINSANASLQIKVGCECQDFLTFLWLLKTLFYINHLHITFNLWVLACMYISIFWTRMPNKWPPQKWCSASDSTAH